MELIIGACLGSWDGWYQFFWIKVMISGLGMLINKLTYIHKYMMLPWVIPVFCFVVYVYTYIYICIFEIWKTALVMNAWQFYVALVALGKKGCCHGLYHPTAFRNYSCFRLQNSSTHHMMYKQKTMFQWLQGLKSINQLQGAGDSSNTWDYIILILIYG